MRVCVVLAMVLAVPAAFSQWTMQKSGVTASLRGIENVGGGVAWASGSGGTVLRTVDGGKKWEKCAVPPGAEKLDFRGVQAFDAKTAIVMSSGPGDLSRLYKTTDGCGTWKLVFTNPDKDGFWDGLRFAYKDDMRFASKSGVLIGDPVDGKFAIFESHDAGETWTRYRDVGGTLARWNKGQANARRGEALFAASNSSILPGFRFVTGGQSGSRVFYTQWHPCGDVCLFGASDFTTFERVSLPMPKASSAGAFSIASRPGPGDSGFDDYMIVGGDYQHPDAAGSSAFLPTPVGRSYALKELPFGCCIRPKTPPHGYRSAVAYDEASKAWITVGPNGTDVSTDNGKNWRALRPSSDDAPDADKNWNALSLPFVVGAKGRIGVLRDGVVVTK